MEGKANLHLAIEAIVEKAKEMTPNTTGIPKTRRIANIKANRAREKAVVRTDESFVSGKLGLEPVEIYQQILPVNSDKEETLSPEVLKIAEQAEEDYKRWELSMMQYTTSKDSQNTETTH